MMHMPTRDSNSINYRESLNNHLRSSVEPLDTTARTNGKNAKVKKVLVVGLDQTGKSSIILKFLYDFPDAKNYGPEESYYTSIKYQSQNFLLNIVDIAGIDKYSPIYAAKYGYKVDGYMFVYSVDNRESFEFVYKLRERIFDLHGKHLPAILVANKCDLKEFRQVSTAEGKEFAKSLMIPYLETSTKKHSNDSIRRVFEELLKEIVRSEANANVKQYLKDWHFTKVEQLYKLIMLASCMIGLAGLFFLSFGASNILNVGQTKEDQNIWSLWQILLMLNGTTLAALSPLALCALRKEEHDFMIIFKVLCVISFIINLGSGLLRAFGGSALQTVVYAPEGRPYPGIRVVIDVLVCSIIFVSTVFLIFLFTMSWVTNEIYVRRKKGDDPRNLAAKPLIL